MKTSIALILVTLPLLFSVTSSYSHGSGIASQEATHQVSPQESIASVIEVEEHVVMHSLPMINYG